MRRVVYSYTHAEQRRDHRFERPMLDVEIEGRTYAAEDWSLGGVRVSGLFAEVGEGMEVHMRFSGVRSGYLYGGEVVAEVVRVDVSRNETALRFNRFYGAAFDALEGLITGRRPRYVDATVTGNSPAGYPIAPTSP